MDTEPIVIRLRDHASGSRGSWYCYDHHLTRLPHRQNAGCGYGAEDDQGHRTADSTAGRVSHGSVDVLVVDLRSEHRQELGTETKNNARSGVEPPREPNDRAEAVHGRKARQVDQQDHQRHDVRANRDTDKSRMRRLGMRVALTLLLEKREHPTPILCALLSPPLQGLEVRDAHLDEEVLHCGCGEREPVGVRDEPSQHADDVVLQSSDQPTKEDEYGARSRNGQQERVQPRGSRKTDDGRNRHGADEGKRVQEVPAHDRQPRHHHEHQEGAQGQHGSATHHHRQDSNEPGQVTEAAFTQVGELPHEPGPDQRNRHEPIDLVHAPGIPARRMHRGDVHDELAKRGMDLRRSRRVVELRQNADERLRIVPRKRDQPLESAVGKAVVGRRQLPQNPPLTSGGEVRNTTTRHDLIQSFLRLVGVAVHVPHQVPVQDVEPWQEVFRTLLQEGLGDPCVGRRLAFRLLVRTHRLDDDRNHIVREAVTTEGLVEILENLETTQLNRTVIAGNPTQHALSMNVVLPMWPGLELLLFQIALFARVVPRVHNARLQVILTQIAIRKDVLCHGGKVTNEHADRVSNNQRNTLHALHGLAHQLTQEDSYGHRNGHEGAVDKLPEGSLTERLLQAIAMLMEELPHELTQKLLSALIDGLTDHRLQPGHGVDSLLEFTHQQVDIHVALHAA